MLFARQKLLLTLLEAGRKPISDEAFQTLLFLYVQECEKVPSYDFIPGRSGGFSYTVQADKKHLLESGLLADTGPWKLTPAGHDSARENAVMPLVVAGFCRRHADLAADALLAEQYRKYPYYAIRSERVAEILPDHAARKRVAEARPPQAKPGLLTIGYEGRSLEAYLNLLLQNSVTLLCDVRRNAFSRKFGFSKNTLSHACEETGILYRHLPELGIATEERRGLETRADFAALFAVYERETLPQQAAALAKIRDWVKDGQRVALTCFELLPQECHRHCVAEALERDGEKDLTVINL